MFLINVLLITASTSQIKPNSIRKSTKNPQNEPKIDVRNAAQIIDTNNQDENEIGGKRTKIKCFKNSKIIVQENLRACDEKLPKKKSLEERRVKTFSNTEVKSDITDFQLNNETDANPELINYLIDLHKIMGNEFLTLDDLDRTDDLASDTNKDGIICFQKPHASCDDDSSISSLILSDFTDSSSNYSSCADSLVINTEESESSLKEPELDEMDNKAVEMQPTGGSVDGPMDYYMQELQKAILAEKKKQSIIALKKTDDQALIEKENQQQITQPEPEIISQPKKQNHPKKQQTQAVNNRVRPKLFKRFKEQKKRNEKNKLKKPEDNGNQDIEIDDRDSAQSNSNKIKKKRQITEKTVFEDQLVVNSNKINFNDPTDSYRKNKGIQIDEKTQIIASKPKEDVGTRENKMKLFTNVDSKLVTDENKVRDPIIKTQQMDEIFARSVILKEKTHKKILKSEALNRDEGSKKNPLQKIAADTLLKFSNYKSYSHEKSNKNHPNNSLKAEKSSSIGAGSDVFLKNQQSFNVINLPDCREIEFPVLHRSISENYSNPIINEGIVISAEKKLTSKNQDMPNVLSESENKYEQSLKEKDKTEPMRDKAILAVADSSMCDSDNVNVNDSINKHINFGSDLNQVNKNKLAIPDISAQKLRKRESEAENNKNFAFKTESYYNVEPISRSDNTPLYKFYKHHIEKEKTRKEFESVPHIEEKFSMTTDTSEDIVIKDSSIASENDQIFNLADLKTSKPDLKIVINEKPNSEMKKEILKSREQDTTVKPSHQNLQLRLKEKEISGVQKNTKTGNEYTENFASAIYERHNSTTQEHKKMHKRTKTADCQKAIENEMHDECGDFIPDSQKSDYNKNNEPDVMISIPNASIDQKTNTKKNRYKIENSQLPVNEDKTFEYCPATTEYSPCKLHDKQTSQSTKLPSSQSCPKQYISTTMQENDTTPNKTYETQDDLQNIQQSVPISHQHQTWICPSNLSSLDNMQIKCWGQKQNADQSLPEKIIPQQNHILSKITTNTFRKDLKQNADAAGAMQYIENMSTVHKSSDTKEILQSDHVKATFSNKNQKVKPDFYPSLSYNKCYTQAAGFNDPRAVNMPQNFDYQSTASYEQMQNYFEVRSHVNGQYNNRYCSGNYLPINLYDDKSCPNSNIYAPQNGLKISNNAYFCPQMQDPLCYQNYNYTNKKYNKIKDEESGNRCTLKQSQNNACDLNEKPQKTLNHQTERSSPIISYENPSSVEAKVLHENEEIEKKWKEFHEAKEPKPRVMQEYILDRDIRIYEYIHYIHFQNPTNVNSYPVLFYFDCKLNEDIFTKIQFVCLLQKGLMMNKHKNDKNKKFTEKDYFMRNKSGNLLNSKKFCNVSEYDFNPECNSYMIQISDVYMSTLIEAVFGFYEMKPYENINENTKILNPKVQKYKQKKQFYEFTCDKNINPQNDYYIIRICNGNISLQNNSSYNENTVYEKIDDQKNTIVDNSFYKTSDSSVQNPSVNHKIDAANAFHKSIESCIMGKQNPQQTNFINKNDSIQKTLEYKSKNESGSKDICPLSSIMKLTSIQKTYSIYKFTDCNISFKVKTLKRTRKSKKIQCYSNAFMRKFSCNHICNNIENCNATVMYDLSTLIGDDTTKYYILGSSAKIKIDPHVISKPKDKIDPLSIMHSISRTVDLYKYITNDRTEKYYAFLFKREYSTKKDCFFYISDKIWSNIYYVINDHLFKGAIKDFIYENDSETIKYIVNLKNIRPIKTALLNVFVVNCDPLSYYAILKSGDFHNCKLKTTLKSNDFYNIVGFEPFYDYKKKIYNYGFVQQTYDEYYKSYYSFTFNYKLKQSKSEVNELKRLTYKITKETKINIVYNKSECLSKTEQLLFFNNQKAHSENFADDEIVDNNLENENIDTYEVILTQKSADLSAKMYFKCPREVKIIFNNSIRCFILDCTGICISPYINIEIRGYLATKYFGMRNENTGRYFYSILMKNPCNHILCNDFFHEYLLFNFECDFAVYYVYHSKIEDYLEFERAMNKSYLVEKK